MRALVLGGKGFIGQALVERLDADGARVWSFDLADYDLTKGSPGFDAKWDVVYLLAATLGVDTVTSDPARVLRTNIRIVQNVLDWLPGKGETLVFASTSEVYAESVRQGLAPVPTSEDVPLLAPVDSKRGAYAVSKLAGECLVRHGHPRAVILRYHNVYGPGQGRGSPGLTVPRRRWASAPMLISSSSFPTLTTCPGCWLARSVPSTASSM